MLLSNNKLLVNNTTPSLSMQEINKFYTTNPVQICLFPPSEREKMTKQSALVYMKQKLNSSENACIKRAVFNAGICCRGWRTCRSAVNCAPVGFKMQEWTLKNTCRTPPSDGNVTCPATLSGCVSDAPVQSFHQTSSWGKEESSVHKLVSCLPRQHPLPSSVCIWFIILVSRFYILKNKDCPPKNCYQMYFI